jgi:hypothetical protein
LVVASATTYNHLERLARSWNIETLYLIQIQSV